MAKQEYEKNQFLLNLCKVELESLIDILRAYINDSKFVLDELFTAGGPDIFRRFDAYNLIVLDVINRARQFASQLREHNITSLVRQSTDSNKSKPFDQHESIKAPGFPQLDLKSFQIGCELRGWVTHIKDEKDLMFYVCQKSVEEILPKTVEDKLVALPGICALPSERIFGMRLTDDEQLRRAVLKQSEQLLLVDVGETMPLPPENGAEYYELPSQCSMMPSQAIYCKLATMSEKPTSGGGDAYAAENGVEILRGVAMNFVTLKVLANNGNYLTVNLLSPKNEFSTLADDDKQLTLMQSIALNSHINIKTTDVESVDIFYGYVNSPVQKMLSWTEDELPVRQIKLHTPFIGELVLVHYPCDARWYRAKVLYYNKKTAMYQVFFVDFGNRESVPLSCLAHCHLSEQAAPFRALRCRLEDVNEVLQVNNATEMEAYDALCEFMLNKTIRMMVKGRTEDALVVKFVSIQSKQKTIA